MRQKINKKQLMFSAGAFISASSLLTKSLYSFLKQDSWIAVLLALFVTFLLVSVYTVLANLFPGSSLIEMNDAVFGSVLGKGVSVLYLFYFYSLAVFNTRDLGSFVQEAILPNTPIVILFVLFVFVCAWAVRTGPENMTRYGALFIFAEYAAVLINSMLLLNETELRHFLPMFTMPLQNYFIGTHIVTMLPFGEIIVFMMFFPNLKDPRDAGSALRGGLLIGVVLTLLIVFRDIAVMGNYLLVSSRPTFSVVRLVNVGEILTRLEIIYAVLLVAMLFFKVSVIYYALVSGISRLLKLQSHKSLVVIFGVWIIVYAQAMFASGFEHMAWNMTAAAVYSTFFVLLLPVVTLSVALIRRVMPKSEPPVQL